MKLAFFGVFLVIGFLLLTSHFGIAIRITNWVFYFLVGFTLWKLMYEKD